MEIHNEASTSLKVTLLASAVILIGTMTYIIADQFRQISAIYAAADNVTVYHHLPAPSATGVDTANPTP